MYNTGPPGGVGGGGGGAYPGYQGGYNYSPPTNMASPPLHQQGSGKPQPQPQPQPQPNPDPNSYSSQVN